MSTMRADQLANRSGTGRPAVVGGEFVAQRFNLNGTGTIVARDSFGIASFVDNGVGDYTANFSVAHPNADYSPVGGVVGIAGGVVYTGNNAVANPPTTTAFRIAAWRQSDFAGNAAREDASAIPAAFIGDAP